MIIKGSLRLPLAPEASPSSTSASAAMARNPRIAGRFQLSHRALPAATILAGRRLPIGAPKRLILFNCPDWHGFCNVNGEPPRLGEVGVVRGITGTLRQWKMRS